MNFVNSKIVKIYISLCVLILNSGFDWSIDWSRRQLDFDKVRNQSRLPSSENTEMSQPSEEVVGLVSKVAEPVEAAQEIVILNTENGFVPQTLRLRKGGNYKIHVVNVNGKEKNVSFIMDAFSESHSTFYGKVKTFNVSPKVDGLYSYQCPETEAMGKVVVYSDRTKSSVKALKLPKVASENIIPQVQEEEVSRMPASLIEENPEPMEMRNR